jgi:hypothetical protein
MKKICVSLSLLLFVIIGHAQIPEDAMKFSWQPVNGTARVNAIGGAMGALGGDISANFTNPAGLALFKTTDLVLSPGYSFLGNKSNFRGTNTKSNDNFFNLGASGIVGGINGSGKWTNKAISFGVTRTANFSGNLRIAGQNDFSSQAEQYAAEAALSGEDIGFLPTSTSVSYGTRLAARNFVIDTATIPGRTSPDIISRAMFGSLVQGGDFLVNQAQTIETSGGITEFALGYAANMDDKFYIGGSLGIPIVQYRKETVFREEDATGDNNNDFNFNEVRENFTTKGFGVNLKFGMIAKPSDFLRLGLTIHSPTWYALKDSYNGSMSTDLEAFRSTPGTITSTLEDILLPGEIPAYNYELVSPWKFMLSGAYVLHQQEDIRQQRGFISADLEYVTYKSNRYRAGDETGDQSYYDAVNDAMKAFYKNAVNFRIGGEVKFTTVMARLGFSYYGSPYADKELKANKMFVSGGVGYRNAGMFIDLTYMHGLQKDVNFPYRLPDKANTFATTKTTAGNVMVTLGFKI